MKIALYLFTFHLSLFQRIKLTMSFIGLDNILAQEPLFEPNLLTQITSLDLSWLINDQFKIQTSTHSLCVSFKLD